MTAERLKAASCENTQRNIRLKLHPDIIYEPGKCIDCGLCVQIASAVGEKPGLTFIGRGFNVRMEVPFGESITEGLKKTAGQCVTACPTGALAFKDNKNQ
ncbi:MAG: hypothetical protein ACYSQZ_02630 [Planctomycetota bacterium]